MRCGKARKLLADLAEGILGARKERKVRSHVATCDDCGEVWERERTVTELLPAWPDVPAPEDALHRIETRIAFAPPPVVVARPGALRTFVLPYAAGLATAAAVLLFARSPEPAAPAATDAVQAAEAETIPALLPNERVLQFVDQDGRLMEAPWNEELDAWLRRRMAPDQYENLRNRVRRVDTSEPMYEGR